MTLDPGWLEQQVDRFLAFELRYHAVHKRIVPISTQLVADKLGMNQGFVDNMLERITRRPATRKLRRRFYAL